MNLPHFTEEIPLLRLYQAPRALSTRLGDFIESQWDLLFPFLPRAPYVVSHRVVGGKGDQVAVLIVAAKTPAPVMLFDRFSAGAADLKGDTLVCHPMGGDLVALLALRGGLLLYGTWCQREYLAERQGELLALLDQHGLSFTPGPTGVEGLGKGPRMLQKNLPEFGTRHAMGGVLMGLFFSLVLCFAWLWFQNATLQQEIDSRGETLGRLRADLKMESVGPGFYNFLKTKNTTAVDRGELLLGFEKYLPPGVVLRRLSFEGAVAEGQLECGQKEGLFETRDAFQKLALTLKWTDLEKTPEGRYQMAFRASRAPTP